MGMLNTLVLIPTYNERHNLPVVVEQVLALPGIRVLVIDDKSPDGTGDIADDLASRWPDRIQAMHRTGERGLGRSYLDGFRAALRSGARFICQMDADLSHDPAFLPSLVDAAESGAGLVIGSRYITGGAVRNWPARRLALSAFANAYVRAITGLRVRDSTSGFRCWRSEALAKIPLERVTSTGYSFLVELVFRAVQARQRIVERPIVFTERRYGASKLSAEVLFESLVTPWRLAFESGRIDAAGSGQPEELNIRSATGGGIA